MMRKPASTKRAPTPATRTEVLTTNVDRMVPEGPSTRANPARGIVLIATALVLGLFVLRQGFETVDVPAAGSGSGAEEESGSADQGSQGTTDVPDGEGEGEGDTSETPPESQEEPLTAPSELTIRVVNTTSIVGTAANWSCWLRDDGGYITDPAQATNLAGERDQRASTTVMHAAGLEGEAAELAQKVGTDVGVGPVPADAPPTDTQGQPLMAEGVQLLVVLGSDLAGNEPSPCEE